MDTAQDYKKLLTEAIQKYMVILGPQITMMKVRNITGMTVSSEGIVTALSDSPQNVVTHFLEQFRDLSAPLVKKSMKPLLSLIGTSAQEASSQTTPDIKSAVKQEKTVQD